jgi:hypothetical protein
MECLAKQKTWRGERLHLAFLIALSLCLSACAAKTSPNAPAASGPPYPVLMTDSTDRRDAALANWATFTNAQGIRNAPAPELQPVTATIRSLPTLTGTPLYLPKVGTGATMTEEETRESLRRLLTSMSSLLGADPSELSLVLRTDLADGTKKARYQQHPFVAFPLRGDYGVLEISFTPDRRVIQITSTCIPEAEQLRRAGAGTRPKQTADQVPKLVAGRTFTYTDAAGNKQTLTIATGDEVTVRELVVYPLPRASDQAVLEFHLAWEINVGSSSNPVTIYLDAVTDEIIAVKQFSK